MGNNLYTTYSVGNDLTLFELDKKVINGVEYMLLLEQQNPNILCVGYFDNNQLTIVENAKTSLELISSFAPDVQTLNNYLAPFVKKE